MPGSTTTRKPSGSAGARAFGDLLKQYRRAAGMTQEALAERAGYSTVYVSMLERGRRLPLDATIQTLAGALALDARDRAALRALAGGAGHPAGGTAGGPSAPPLVGRERERAVLERHLAGEGPPLLLMAGEPGIGKTSLLRETRALGASRGWRVLDGGCLRRGGQDPYAPLLEAIQRHLRDHDDDQLRADLRGCAWLVRLLPELADGPIEPLPAWSLPPERERRLMDEAVVRFLANVAGPAGTLLLLDDLQWAGVDALDLLALLARTSARPGDVAGPLRVVAAYRDIEVHRQHPLSALLADLAHAGLVAHLALGPLSPTEASALLDYLLEGVEGAGPELRERLLRRADGVPFFVTSCAQGIRLGASDAASLDALPWDVSQSVRQRAATLPPVAQDVLGLTAVVGRRAGSELLLAVAGHEAAAVLEALEAACRARLLEEDGDGAYHFTHDVIREVVEADLSAARRTMLHRRVGEELERRQAPVETLAFHFSRSGDPARAALYLERAGDSARAQHAIATAEGYYRELVDRLDGRGHLAEAAAAREKLGTTLTTTGRYGEALAVLREAARTYGDLDDLEGEGRAVARIGRVQYLAGAPEEGIALLEPLRDRLSQSACGGEAPSQALAALNVALAPLYLARSRYRDQLEAARTAAALARRLGDDRLLAEAEVWRGCALNQLGSLEEGRRVQEAAIPLAEAVDDLASLSHALNDMGFLYEVEGRFARSRGYKERALQVAERMGDPAGIANMAFRCGQNAFLAGDWTRARQYFERAVDSAGQLGSSTISAYPLFGLGLLATARGDFKAARQHLAACRAVADRTEDAQVLRAVQGVLAEQELLEGRPQAAHDRLRSLDPSEEGLGLHSLLPVLAETCLAAGERDAARGHLATSLDRATARRDNLLLVDTLRVQALLALREERWSDADQTLDEGLRLARGMPHPYAEGRLLHLRSLLDIRRGAPERARGHLGAALQIFQRLGARRHAEDALRALEGLDAGA